MTTDDKIGAFQEISIGSLFASPTNPRRSFPKAEAERFRGLIEERGILQNLVVRPVDHRFEIVAGERRFRAAEALGLKVVPCMVRVLSDEDVRKIQLIENIQRADLSPVEESNGVADLEELGLSAKDISLSVGRPVGWVQTRLQLGKLPKVAKKAVDAGRIGLGAVGSLATIADGECEEFVQGLLAVEEVPSDEVLAGMIYERYRKPGVERKSWLLWCDEVAGQERFEGCDFLEDPARWAEYVRPFGEAASGWKLQTDKVGGLAARPEDMGVTWGMLAEAHEVSPLVVPVGSLKGAWKDQPVALVVNRAMIEDGERARKSMGSGYTLGPKVAGKVKVKVEPEVEVGVRTAEEDPRGDLEVCAIPLRDRAWNPWVIAEVEMDDQTEVATALLLWNFLGAYDRGWEKRLAVISGGVTLAELHEEFGTVVPGVIWFFFEGLEVSDPVAQRVARSMGVLELWRERGEA